MKPRKQEAKRKTTAATPAPSTSPRRKKLAASALAAIVVLAAVATFFWRSGPSQADLRPIRGQNVLLITIDTLRADALGSSGGPAATPVLDRLAAEGVRFDFAHAHAVITLTSHASILTGEYPFQHGLRENFGFRLASGARTAATILKKAGYATAAFVAAFPLHSRFGLNAGFDVYDDRFEARQGPVTLITPERLATEVVPLARDWIAARAGEAGGGGPDQPAARPWFTWVHVFDPHAPYRPPAPFDTQYANQPYYGEVAATDAALAPLLDDVRRSARPTLVIVTGDHGEGLGDHGELAHGIFAYESTLRVPLIIAELGGGASAAGGTTAPGGPHAGEVSSVAARHIDILPTILDAVGQAVPSDLRGRTLLPRHERRPGAPPRAMYFEAMSGMLNHGWAPLTGVIAGGEKFIDLPIPERYDLANDSAEQSNVFGRPPERDRALAAALAGFGPSLPGRRTAEDSEAAARLRALGYVSKDIPKKARYTEDDDPKRLTSLDSAVHQAIDAFLDGHVAEAVQTYQQVIDRRPDMAVAYRHLAYIEWRNGNAARAIAVLRLAVANGVTGSRTIGQLGEYLADSGHVAEGISVLEPLAGDPAADTGTLNALGIAYAQVGRIDDARRMFERLLTIIPERSAPLENLGVLALEQGNVGPARAYFERAIAVAPDSSRAYAGLGSTAFRGGDRQAAYKAWARAVELDPANFEALYNLATNLAHDGQMDAARPYLDRFLRTAPPAVHANARREVSRLLRSGR